VSSTPTIRHTDDAHVSVPVRHVLPRVAAVAAATEISESARPEHAENRADDALKSFEQEQLDDDTRRASPRHFIVPIRGSARFTDMSIALRMPTNATSSASATSHRLCVSGASAISRGVEATLLALHHRRELLPRQGLGGRPM
jgi:hypothetical protein